ncbi:MAG: hypothetical protein WCT52_00685 [Candidatus Micrarchaeia archaeon]
MAGFGKSFGYAKTSILGYVGIWLLATVLGFLPIVELVGGLIGTLQFWIINPILLAYAGYAAVKIGKENYSAAVLSGALAGFAGSAIVAVLSVILVVFGIGVAAGSDAAGIGIGAVVAGLVGVGQMAMVVMITICGAVLGLVGAIVAGKPQEGKAKAARKK